MAQQDVKMTVPAGEPAVAAAPDPVPVAVGQVLGGGAAVIDQRPLEEEGREMEGAVLGEHEVYALSDEDFSDDDSDVDSDSELEDDDLLSGDDSSDDDDDDDDSDVDSDSEFEEDGQPPDAGHAAAVAAKDISAWTAGFLGRPTLAASVQNTIGFMRVAAAEPAPGKVGGGGEILVHYQYTRFSRARSGGDAAVDMHTMGPKLASVRFHVPAHAAASDPASSLRLAGASLASLIYPARSAVQLRVLWFVLVGVAQVRVPPRATRLVVTVDVGILQPGDRTPERVRSVCAALESVACERDTRPAAVGDVGMELHLPAPLASEDDVLPAKRRRVAGEDCPICFEALERDLAAWPRCSHIFHGRCLEQHLVRGHEQCPLCRTELKVHASSRE